MGIFVEKMLVDFQHRRGIQGEFWMIEQLRGVLLTANYRWTEGIYSSYTQCGREVFAPRPQLSAFVQVSTLLYRDHYAI